MGFILSVRHAVGLSGVDDGGLGSALADVSRIELLGAVVRPDSITPPAYEVVLDPEDVPPALRDDDA